MSAHWFDERFIAAGARSFQFSPVRLAMAAILGAILGLGVGWPVAGLWVAAVVAMEWPLREATRPMAAGLPVSRLRAWMCAVAYAVAVPT